MPATVPSPGPHDSDDPHAHGPFPSYEWILDGKREIVLPHLKTIAPTLKWKDDHFHINDIEPTDEDLPELFQVQLGDEAVGAVDFMPLPANRTLMRLYLCSDLGTSCSLENGNAVIQGFATAWLDRLKHLGFLATKAQATEERRLGFALPDTSDD